MKHVLDACLDDGHMLGLDHLLGPVSNGDGKLEADGDLRGLKDLNQYIGSHIQVGPGLKIAIRFKLLHKNLYVSFHPQI